MLNSAADRILIFRIGELGDTLIALPALSAIRQTFPRAHIALMGNADNHGRHVTPKQILPSQGLIDDWISYTRESSTTVAGRWRLLKQLRRERFETLVYLAPRIRASKDIRRDLLFFRLAGIRKVIGHDGFASLPRQAGRPLSEVDQEADHLLRRLSLSGISVPAAGSATFELALTDAEQSEARTWWQRNVPGNNFSNAVGFGPGSKWPSKVWPEDRFAELGRRLVQTLNIFPIVFGGAEDRELGQQLITTWGRGANAAGALPVRPAAAALSRCRLYVGNDTGTMHLAAAVGTRCIAIMSAQDWPGHWNPYGTGHIVLRRSVPCEGCMLRVCEKEDLRCLKEISVEAVVEACGRLLSTKSEEQRAERLANSFRV